LLFLIVEQSLRVYSHSPEGGGLIFVTGLPRSGTTLLYDFLALHKSNITTRNKLNPLDQEWVPKGSMRYGAEHECLRRMCGKEDGYIRIARYDRARLDIRNYDQSVPLNGCLIKIQETY